MQKVYALPWLLECFSMNVECSSINIQFSSMNVRCIAQSHPYPTSSIFIENSRDFLGIKSNWWMVNLLNLMLDWFFACQKKILDLLYGLFLRSPIIRGPFHGTRNNAVLLFCFFSGPYWHYYMGWILFSETKACKFLYQGYV